MKRRDAEATPGCCARQHFHLIYLKNSEILSARDLRNVPQTPFPHIKQEFYIYLILTGLFESELRFNPSKHTFFYRPSFNEDWYAESL